MNFRAISKLLGLLSLGLGLTMLGPVGWSLWYADGALSALGGSILVCLVLGGALWALGRQADLHKVFRREGLVVVGVGWLLCAVLGALPYLFSGVLASFVPAVFESMSGFTTTGASVFGEREFRICPQSVLFWRSLTQWLGGMGIVVLFVAALPLLGVSGKQLLRFEVPGPNKDGLTPRVSQTASALWLIYVALTALQALLLSVEGMSLFDALCHTFATMSTGGFSNRYESVMFYHSPIIELTIVLFMFLAGSNFSLYYRVWKGDRWALLRDTEWRVYLGVLAGATAVVGLLLWGRGLYDNLLDALRFASFQVVSLQTTTGFVSADYEPWPPAARVLLIAVMFVGGCAGSTGGGIKVVRFVILSRIAQAELRRVFAPHTVTRVTIGGQPVSDEDQRQVLFFFFAWMAVYLALTVFVALFTPHTEGSIDVTTAATAVAATLNNVGPGLALVGATGNYAVYPAPVLLVLTLAMELGRLELFAVLALVMPSFWRQK